MQHDTENSSEFQETISATEHMQRAVFFSRLAFSVNDDPGLKRELAALSRKHSRLAEDAQ